MCVPGERKAVSLPTGHNPMVTVQVTKLLGSIYRAAFKRLPKPVDACRSKSTGACTESQHLLVPQR